MVAPSPAPFILSVRCVPPCPRASASPGMLRAEPCQSSVSVTAAAQPGSYQPASATSRFDSASSFEGKPGKMSRCLTDLAFIICSVNLRKGLEKKSKPFCQLKDGHSWLSRMPGAEWSQADLQKHSLWRVRFIVMKMIQCRTFSNGKIRPLFFILFWMSCHGNKMEINGVFFFQICAHCRSSQNSSFPEWTKN